MLAFRYYFGHASNHHLLGTLFPSANYRFRGSCIDAKETLAQPEQRMRPHAHVENHIQRLKDWD